MNDTNSRKNSMKKVVDKHFRLAETLIKESKPAVAARIDANARHVFATADIMKRR